MYYDPFLVNKIKPCVYFLDYNKSKTEPVNFISELFSYICDKKVFFFFFY